MGKPIIRQLRVLLASLGGTEAERARLPALLDELDRLIAWDAGFVLDLWAARAHRRGRTVAGTGEELSRSTKSRVARMARCHWPESMSRQGSGVGIGGRHRGLSGLLFKWVPARGRCGKLGDMRRHRKWFPIVGLCAALPTAVALASGAGRLGVSARRGQWTVGDCSTREFRTATGGEVFLEWLGDNFRVTAGYRVIREQIEEVNGEAAVPPGRGELQLATSVLAAWRHKWFEIGAGVGYLRYADAWHEAQQELLPAATLRLGPEWFHVQGSLLDFSAESLGIGMLRIGLGGEIDRVDLFGGLAAQPYFGGVTAGVMFPVSEKFFLRADAIYGVDNDEHPSYEAGLGLTYRFADEK